MPDPVSALGKLSMWKILEGHALEMLRELPAGCVQTCVTSPPYHRLRDYKTGSEFTWPGGWRGELGREPTVRLYIEHLVVVFREVKRVLADDGTLWLNLGDNYGPDKQLNTIPWEVALALRRDGWILRSDIIWCLSGGTRIYARTQKGDGPHTLKDLVRLDPATVQLWNGKRWTQVIGWHRTARRGDPLMVELRSGERLHCTPGHIWPTQRGNVRADALESGDVIERTRLPEPDQPRRPVLLPDEDIGWFVGLYLAEGSISGNVIQIAGNTNEKDRATRLAGLALDVDGSHARHQTSENGVSDNLHSPVLMGVIKRYVGGRNAKSKRLKQSCWHRSDSFLLHVLMGYCDGDAHYDAKNDRYRLGFARNDRLAADLRTLCARLGFRITLRPSFADFNGARFPTYRGEIRLSPPTGHHNEKDRNEIVSITRSNARAFWDVEVADDPHLFALASGTLTHNSKPNAMPEPVKDRPTCAHEYVFLLAKQKTYYYDQEAIRGEWADKRKGRAGNRDQDVGGQLTRNEGGGRGTTRRPSEAPKVSGPNARTVWPIATVPFPGAHYAVFPPALPERCILAGSRPEDTVLDPFSGTATTGERAIAHGRFYIGCELNPESIKLGKARLIGADKVEFTGALVFCPGCEAQGNAHLFASAALDLARETGRKLSCARCYSRYTVEELTG